jgi:predicted nucleic acid-binding protein
VHEFLAIVTHPRIYRPASTMAQALDQVDAWLESPSLVMLGEASGHAETLRAVLESARVVGAQVHDARIFAICLASGVSELWTADRDFNRFSGLNVKNPLVGR